MNQSTAEKAFTTPVVLLCFAALAWLNVRSLGYGVGGVAIYVGIGLLLLIVGLVLMTAFNLAAVPSAIPPWGYGAVWGVVARGFLIVVPLTLLAALSELAYHWHAAQAFTQASLMTSGAAAGAELMRRAGARKLFMVVSMIVAVVLSVAWIGFTHVYAMVMR